jgi:hypothetical protein
MDRIVYVLVTKDGGVDGRDSTAIGGKDVQAFFSEDEAKKSPKFPYCTIRKEIAEVENVRSVGLAKLTPTEILILNIDAKIQMPRT